MFLFLSYRGRLPIRTFMVITISADTFLGLSFIKMIDVKKLYKEWGISVIGVSSMLLIMMYNVRAVYFTDDCTKTQTQTSATTEQVLEFEDYAIDNPDNVYVYDFTVATLHRDPFVVYPESKPVNCIVSGGSYTFSTIYYKQLEKNGMESLYWTDFLKDNVYYATSDLAYIDLMSANIEEKSGEAVFYEEIKDFGEEGVKIYKFFTED